jgi:hypothetical protein
MTIRATADLAFRIIRSDAVFVLALLALAWGVVLDIAG